MRHLVHSWFRWWFDTWTHIDASCIINQIYMNDTCKIAFEKHILEGSVSWHANRHDDFSCLKLYFSLPRYLCTSISIDIVLTHSDDDVSLMKFSGGSYWFNFQQLFLYSIFRIVKHCLLNTELLYFTYWMNGALVKLNAWPLIQYKDAVFTIIGNSL